MKRKEIKQFIKEFKEGDKALLIQDLFHSWVKEFEKFGDKSGQEVIGLIQRCNIAWRELNSNLPAFKDDLYLTDYAFSEFFFQNAKFIYKDLYSKNAIDKMAVACHLDPELLHERCEHQTEISYTRNKKVADFDRFNKFTGKTGLGSKFKAIY